jgi:hypothetical protein
LHKGDRAAAQTCADLKNFKATHLCCDTVKQIGLGSCHVR